MQSVNLQAVVDSNYPAVIRAAALKLMTTEYLHVGTFLRELPQSDLAELSGRCTRVVAGANSDEDFDCLILLSCMLSQAEGGSFEESVQSRVSNLIILITFEELERKGVIEFRREKATLCNEFLDEDLARVK